MTSRSHLCLALAGAALAFFEGLPTVLGDDPTSLLRGYNNVNAEEDRAAEEGNVLDRLFSSVNRLLVPSLPDRAVSVFFDHVTRRQRRISCCLYCVHKQ